MQESKPTEPAETIGLLEKKVSSIILIYFLYDVTAGKGHKVVCNFDSYFILKGLVFL